MALRDRPPPSFTLQDYHELDMLGNDYLLQEQRQMLSRSSVTTLRILLVKCGIEGSRSEAAYWTKADMIEAIAEHRVLEARKEDR